MIRWSLQRGVVCIPKTQNEERLKENISIFDFTISQEDMADLVSSNCMVSNISVNVLILNVQFLEFTKPGSNY